MFLRLLLTVFIAIACCSDGLALTAAESIARFQANEVRIDTFVNDEGYYTTTGGDRVETLPSLVIRKDAEISERYNVEAKGTWLTATAYVVNDAVTQGGSVYLCVVTHTSGTFSTDLAAGKWVIYQMALPFGEYCDTEAAVITANANPAKPYIVPTLPYQLKADLAIAAGKMYAPIPGAVVATNYSIRSADYRWVLTGSGTAEYRCELAAGTDPGFSQPTAVWINGAEATEGTAGALNSGEWDYSGGYIIARMGADSDPDSEALGYVEVHYTFDASLGHIEDNGGQIFSSSPGEVIGLTTATLEMFGGGVGASAAANTNALNIAVALQLPIQLREGDYDYTPPLSIAVDSVHIRGAGKYLTTLVPSATAAAAIEIGVTGNSLGVVLEDFGIDGNATNTHGIVIGDKATSKYGASIDLNRIYITGFTDTDSDALRCSYTWWLNIRNCNIEGNFNNFHIPDGSVTTTIHISGNTTIRQASNYGMFLEGATLLPVASLIVDNTSFEYNAEGAVYSTAVSAHMVFNECHFEQNSATGVGVLTFIGGSGTYTYSVLRMANCRTDTPLAGYMLSMSYMKRSEIDSCRGFLLGTIVTDANCDVTFKNMQQYSATDFLAVARALLGKVTALEYVPALGKWERYSSDGNLFENHINTYQATADVPTVAGGAALGAGGSVVMTARSTDTNGRVEATFGASGWAAGIVATVTFDRAYARAPIVVITPSGGIGFAQTALGLGVATVTTGGFDIYLNSAVSAGGLAYYNYIVMGVE